VNVVLTFNEIKEIINLVNQSCIQHFELNHEATNIVIDKHSLPSTTENKIGLQDASAVDSTLVLSGESHEKQLPRKEVPDQQGDNLYKIVSPTVGTFYSAPEPGADPFIKINQQVNSNEIVCVLEAMKLFNEVEAGVNGTIIEVLFKDGEFVEYGDTLFLVKQDV